MIQPNIGTSTMKIQCTSLFLLCCVLVCAASPLRAEVYSDRVAAIVNGDVILVSDIEKFKSPFYRSNFKLDLGIVPPGKWPTEREILDELIVIHLLEQEAQKKGIATDDKAAQVTIDEMRKRRKMSKNQLALFLAANKIGYAEFLKMMKRRITLSMLVGSEVRGKVPLSEEDNQEYFKENQGKIDEQYDKLLEVNKPAAPPRPELKQPVIPTHVDVYEGGRVKLRSLVLPIPSGAGKAARKKILEKANKIYVDARTGEDFKTLVKKHSKGPMAQSGGDLGWMSYKDMVPNMQKMVKTLKVGDVSQPAVGPQAIMMFYLEDGKGRKAKKVPLPKRIREQLKKQLEERRKRAEALRAEQKKQKDRRRESTAPSRKPKNAPKKDLGILTPEEEKAYDKVRHKVNAILLTQKTQERMKEWVEELKKNSVIEVKL
jgi:peptidyl-prolyl cis-trans isomerase SurA